MAQAAVKAAASEPPKEKRTVVGLPQAAPLGKKRRNKKSNGPLSSLGGVENIALEPVEDLELPEPSVEADNGAVLDSLPAGEDLEEDKRFSAVSVLQKRIKAHNKKLQRIVAYEAEPGKLNPDQQKAVASKPFLEQGIKELQELVAVFQAEEAEEDKRIQRRDAAVHRRAQAQIQAALKSHEAEAEVHLAFLLQFLHLRSLFVPSESSFAPPTRPPVVANATPQEYGAVMTLFDALANGPLTGGGEDALERVKHLYEGSAVQVVEGIDYGRIKRMIGDLTAPPEPLAPTGDVSAVAAQDSVLPPAMAISFMQASDIAPPLGGDLDPPSTPDADPFAKAGPAMPVNSLFGPPATNWADDVEPPVSTEATTAGDNQPAGLTDGASTVQSAPFVPNGGRQVNGGRRGENGFEKVAGGAGRGARGGRGGRGGSRGRGAGVDGERRGGGAPRGPRPERAENGERVAAGERGRGRGGRGNRGRGAPPTRKAPAPATEATG